MSDTLLVDAADVQSANRIIQMWDDAVSTPMKRGANIVIPYAAGELYVPKKQDARDFTIGMLIRGGDAGGAYIAGQEFHYLNANIDALYALLPDLTADDTTCTLTLRRTFPAPTGVVDKTSSAEYRGGLAPEYLSTRQARLTLRFRLLDGGFA